MIDVRVVMTARALERLAAGAPMNFAGAELFEVYEEAGPAAARLIYARGDQADDRLLMIMGSGTGSILPEVLRNRQDPAIRRILSFVQRASTYPVTLPRGWKQYKAGNLLAFFALPESFGESERWIAEVNAGGVGDTVFWTVTTTDDQQILSSYRPEPGVYESSKTAWVSTFEKGMEALSGPSTRSGIDVDLTPAPQASGVSKMRTFRQWLPELTDSQREFIDAPSDKGIRLRGPAGSGKTLSLAIKAVQEATDARTFGDPVRILFVTHSWALAGEVDQLLTLLSEQGVMGEINTLPLVAVAQEIMPAGMIPSDLSLIGDDSLTGKFGQLAEIDETLNEFLTGDWITYRGSCSEDFRARIESTDSAMRRGVAWDFLIEFGCVLGADGIFPGLNSEKRYLRLQRAPWMMRLETVGDRRATYAIYAMYYRSLQGRGQLTSDQLLSDFLNYLEGFTWNHRRRSEGYDYIFVDEFHLFNTLERQILRCLSREVSSYPRIFMALDPRQSPWDVYFGSDETRSTSEPGSAEDDLEPLKTVDIPTVHRSSPQILDLIKHIHLDYANLSLDDDWDYSISNVESLADVGPKPSLFVADTFAEEEVAIYNAISDVYPRAHAGADVALAILDEDVFARYRPLIERIGNSGKFTVILISGRDDLQSLQYRNRGIVVGPAEYLAGLQFDTVLVAGVHEDLGTSPHQGVRKRGALSLLYLAVSRASREVRIFSNDDFGGIPEVLSRAQKQEVLGIFRA